MAGLRTKSLGVLCITTPSAKVRVPFRQVYSYPLIGENPSFSRL